MSASGCPRLARHGHAAARRRLRSFISHVLGRVRTYRCGLVSRSFLSRAGSPGNRQPNRGQNERSLTDVGDQRRGGASCGRLGCQAVQRPTLSSPQVAFEASLTPIFTFPAPPLSPPDMRFRNAFYDLNACLSSQMVIERRCTRRPVFDRLLKSSRQWLATMFTSLERGPMKLKHLAAFLMLLAVGCAQQPSSESTAPATDSGSSVSSTEPAATSTVESETEMQLALTTVSFDVTGMK